MIIKISGKKLSIKNTHFHGVGVRGRNSDNKLYRENVGWEPTQSLREGIIKTYSWIKSQVESQYSMSTAELDMRDRFQA